jgi:NAD(P)-dependent dehydrogenase (short-subunit alcohol dehydrogenase family)
VPDFEDLNSRAVEVEILGSILRVCSLEDLKAMKRAAGRTRDLADIEDLDAASRWADHGTTVYPRSIGRLVVITGASDGIGAAAAHRLAAAGEKVVVVGRSAEKTRAVAEAIDAPHHLCDFTELDQVRALAAALLAGYPRIDVLANNAGGIMGRREVTGDGFEKTFQVNHLAPFLLTHLLMPTLVESSAKVLQTSSQGSRVGRLDLDDLQSEQGYSSLRAYGTAKLENILFTKELHRRFHGDGISAAAFHPGIVASNFGDEVRWIYHSPLSRLLISPKRAGRRLTWLVEGTPGTTWQSGGYYERDRPAKKVNPQALDPIMAEGLWERSLALLGI